MSTRGRGRGRGNYNNTNSGNNNHNNNNDGGNMLNQLAQTLATLVGNQQPAQRSIVSEFKRLNPPTFDGATNPAVVEKWTQEMEKAFELMGSNDAQKVTLAVYQLQGSAYDWWLMEQRRNEGNPDPVTWERFKAALTDKYFPRTVRVQKERDFIRLEQGDRTVTEYEAEFSKLSKYAPTLVADEVSRARRLEEGLRADIRHAVANFELGTYEQVLNKALVVERGLVDAKKKKDEDGKKRNEPTSGFNDNGPAKKFGNRGFGGNANKGTQGTKLHVLGAVAIIWIKTVDGTQALALVVARWDIELLNARNAIRPKTRMMQIKVLWQLFLDLPTDECINTNRNRIKVRIYLLCQFI